MAHHYRPPRPPRPPLTAAQKETGFKFWGGFAIGVMMAVAGFVLYTLSAASSTLQVEKIGAGIALVALVFGIAIWILRRIRV